MGVFPPRVLRRAGTGTGTGTGTAAASCRLPNPSLSSSRGRGLKAMEPSPSRLAAEAADPLSSLPAPLLEEILACLDLRDAVRTSVLSRAWRHRWQFLPGLALSFPKDTDPHVVDRVLLLYACPVVSRFAFHIDEASASDMDYWLVALSRRGVQSISIKCHPQCCLSRCGGPTLHSSIFSCARIVSLHLDWGMGDFPLVPVGFAGFPLLEELCLTSVEFGYGDLAAITRGSPLLRVLSLRDVDCDFVIEAPNLQSLTLISTFGGDWEFIGELPCLQYANISVPNCPGLQFDLGGFLAPLAQVEELTFLSPDRGVEIDKTPFTFYNLKSLELSTHFLDINPVLLMFCLLRSSPNLGKLELKMHGPEWDEFGTLPDWESPNWELLNAHWTDGMCTNLQIVKIISARQQLPIAFMKLILAKASLLRTLSVNKRPRSRDDPLNELLKCRKASAQAEVLFKV